MEWPAHLPLVGGGGGGGVSLVKCHIYITWEN